VVRIHQLLEIDAVPEGLWGVVVSSHAPPFAPASARLLESGGIEEIFRMLLGSIGIR
jgi:hypothetical protein